jgi:hypothetical protein
MSDLIITLTRNFETESLYQDHNSGASKGVGFWRAVRRVHKRSVMHRNYLR